MSYACKKCIVGYIMYYREGEAILFVVVVVVVVPNGAVYAQHETHAFEKHIHKYKITNTQMLSCREKR